MEKRYISLVMGFPLFREMKLPEMENVFKSGQIRTLSPGDELFHQGDSPQDILLLIEGSLEAYIEQGQKRRILNRISPGNILGDLGILCRQDRSCSVRACEASVLLSWDNQAFFKLLVEEPVFSKCIFSHSLKSLLDQEKRLIEKTTFFDMREIPTTLKELNLWWNLHQADIYEIPTKDALEIANKSFQLNNPFMALEIVDLLLKNAPENQNLLLLKAKYLSNCGAKKGAWEIVEKLYGSGCRETYVQILLGQLKLESLQWCESQRELVGRMSDCVALVTELVCNVESPEFIADVRYLAARTMIDCWHHYRGAVLRLADLIERQSRLNLDKFDNSGRLKILGARVLASILLKKTDVANELLSEIDGYLTNISGKELTSLGWIQKSSAFLIHELELEGKNIRLPRLPGIAVFSGHMVDKVGREIPRFPLAKEAEVKSALTKELKNLGIEEGFSSCACGGDVLFNEILLEMGKKINLVLQCPVDEFKTICLSGFEGDWENRFDRIYENASSVLILSEQCASDSAIASECCNRVMLGLGRMRANTLNTDVTTVSLWDGKQGDDIGGTYSMVKFAHEGGVRVRAIDPIAADQGARDVSQEEISTATSDVLTGKVSIEKSSIFRLPSTRYEPSQQLCAFLFADVVKFSTIRERQMPKFVDFYLAAVGDMIENFSNSILARNTWGDGLYLVFDSVKSAGLFALELRDFVNARNWNMAGLPEKFNVRIGLHAGAAYRVEDPITKQTSFMGSQVSKGARIEPKTPPGQVYCSRSFAAFAAAEAIRDFSTEYVGKLEWAKGAGSFQTYVVERLKVSAGNV